MDAVKFLQERNRMFLSGAATPGIELEDDFDPVKVVEIIERWSVQHPRRTRQDVFLEQWPNAYVNESDGLLVIGPCVVDETQRKKNRRCGTKKENCYQCRQEYWMQEAK